jgi:hypothetical protein
LVVDRKASRIVDVIDDVIGGGEITGFSHIQTSKGCKVYLFPVYQAPKRQDSMPETPRTDLWDCFKGHRAAVVYALKDLGAYDLKSTAALSAKEIAGYKNVGEKSIAGLRAVLQSKGLDLQP